MKTEEYEPYGIEWESEMKKFPKQTLIIMLKGAYQNGKQSEKELSSYTKALTEINQMSDSGDPLTSVINMKQIASKALERSAK